MDAHLPSDVQRFSPASGGRPSTVTPSQVIALGLVAVSIGWAVWLLRERPTPGETELLSGTVLPASELAVVEAAFDRAKLTDYRTEAGRIYVPRSRQSAYMRAVVDAEALPREFGGSLRRALAANSPWQSKSVQADVLRVATQEELSLVICSMPGIERAAVLYDVEDRPSLDAGIRGGPSKTASVNVRTQPDTELDPARVMAIRVLVASAIAGLPAERVAVTDLRSGRVFSGPLEQEPELAATDPMLARRAVHERHLAAKLRQSLAFVKGAIIDVAVGFDDSGSAAEAEATPTAEPVPAPSIAAANAPLEINPRPAVTAPAPRRRTGGEAPSSIHVSVAVPDSYFEAAVRAAVARGATALGATADATAGTAPAGELSPQGVADAEVERIRGIVLQMIPATPDPAGTRVVVTGFPAVQQATLQQANIQQAVSRQVLPRRDPTDAASMPQGDAADAGKGRAAAPISLADLVRSLQDENGGLRLEGLRDLPREAWLAASSVCVGLLAGLLWWSGSRSPAPPRRRESARRRGAQPPIDWSGIEDGGDAGFEAAGFDGTRFDAGDFAGAAVAGHDDRRQRHDSRAAA